MGRAGRHRCQRPPPAGLLTGDPQGARADLDLRSHRQVTALRWLLRAGSVLVTFAVADYLVLPQLIGARRAIRLLAGVHVGWVVVGAVLEALSLASYSMLTRSVLPSRPRFDWLLRTDVTALGVGHVLPGGGAVATALRFRLLRDGGTPADEAGVGIAVQAVESTLVLAGMLWVSLVVSIPFAGLHPLYVTVAMVGAVAIAAVTVGVTTHHDGPPPGPAPHWLTGWLPAPLRGRAEQLMATAQVRLHQLTADRGGVRTSSGWAAGSWGLEAASLGIFLLAFGTRVNPLELFVAYGFANVVAIVPISPGGLGVIEGILIPSLVGFGTPTSTALLAVVSWRVVSFWAPIPAAGVCYASLRAELWRGAHPKPA